MAAGQSTRTLPLTENRPKPLLKILNKTILEHSIEAVADFVSEIYIIVNYKKEMIIDFVDNHLKKRFKNIKFNFIYQKETLGTGHALLQAEQFIKGKFIVMNGDDLFSRKDIIKCLNFPRVILAKNVDDPSQYGILEVQNNKDNSNNNGNNNVGKLINLIEKPKKGSEPSHLANTGFYVLDKGILC